MNITDINIQIYPPDPQFLRLQRTSRHLFALSLFIRVIWEATQLDSSLFPSGAGTMRREIGIERECLTEWAGIPMVSRVGH